MKNDTFQAKPIKVVKKKNEGGIMKRKMLTGGQAKLDKNKNNRIDAEDFKMLRAEKSKKKPIKAVLGTIAMGAMAAKMLKDKKKKSTKMPGVGGALGSGMLPGMTVADLYQKKLQGKRKGGMGDSIIDRQFKKRRQNYEMFTNLINQYSKWFYPLQDNPGNSSFCLPFICKHKNIMNNLKILFTKYGIEYRPIVSGNLLRQPFLKNYTLNDSTNVDLLHNNGVYIGNSHFVGSYQFEILSRLLKEYDGRRKVRKNYNKSSTKNTNRIRTEPYPKNS